MAKIRSFGYKNEISGLYIEPHLEYSTPERYSERKGFFVRIPEEYQALRDDPTFYNKTVFSWRGHGKQYVAACGATEEEAITNFNTYMDTFIKSASAEQDVILYKFKYKTPKGDSDDDDFYTSDKSEIEMSFDYCVCVKKSVGNNAAYYRKSKPKKMKVRHYESEPQKIHGEVGDTTGRYNHWVEIPHTPEAEQFFKDLHTAMVTLCNKFTTFMGTQQDILKTLESKQKLLQ